MKVIFLVAATSSRWIGELCALLVDPLYTVFRDNKVVFLPNMVCKFLINELIILPLLVASELSQEDLTVLDGQRCL